MHLTWKVIGFVLVLLGLFYALAPHSMHVSSGLGFGFDHTVHVILGLTFLISGAYLGWMMQPLDKMLSKKATRRSARRRR